MARTILGFDFGTKSIGAAVGQDLTGTASPLEALRARDGIPDWNEVGKLFSEWKPDLVVVGLPLNMDGTEQLMTFRARKFGNRLRERFRTEVKFQDERLTTKSSREELFAGGGASRLEKGRVDSCSAVLILEEWMEENPA